MEVGNNIPAVLSDSLNGMRQVVEHLVTEHHRRRVAFICGPAGQFEAEQRYQAYVETLQVHGIPLDPQLVVPGDFSIESGRAAVATLLDERHAKFDAIAAANDRMAFGALDALQEHSLQVPTDVALVGFDDVLEAQVLGVPLTTVRQPFYASGQQAVSTIVNLLRGETVPKQVVMPTELVTRWSCGCLPLALRQVARDDLEMLVEPGVPG
jgi:DNA-binding LacI/PurR family transcriptional regulator